MRVTKDEVAILVEQILQKRKDEYLIKVELFWKEVEKYFRSRTDPKILECYELYPNYFNKLYFHVRGAGVGINIDVPTLKNCSFTPSDTNEKIIKLAAELCEIYGMIGKVRESLKAHISSLRTLERIKDQFPEVTIEPKVKTMELSLITPDMLYWLEKG